MIESSFIYNYSYKKTLNLSKYLSRDHLGARDMLARIETVRTLNLDAVGLEPSAVVPFYKYGFGSPHKKKSLRSTNIPTGFNPSTLKLNSWRRSLLEFLQKEEHEGLKINRIYCHFKRIPAIYYRSRAKYDIRNKKRIKVYT